MDRRQYFAALLLLTVVFSGCTNGSLSIPRIQANNGGTPAVSPQFGFLGGGIPDGVQVAFIGDVVLLRGVQFRPDMRVFIGMNNLLARRPDSLLTTERHLLPGEPFVYTDPVTAEKTILEVESIMEFTHQFEVRITIPPAVACNDDFTNPIVRLYGDAGSSFPEADLYYIVGPRCTALTPMKGVDIGGYDVTVHGDFFSPSTHVGFRYRDPTDGTIKVLGTTAATDINELWIDRHTMVIPNWPGIVPDSLHGLARELEVDVLLFEAIDELSTPPTCDPLRPESSEVKLETHGVRNSEKAGGFVFLPTGVTDYPRIEGLLPESGSEMGGNTVIIHGQQFDGFTAERVGIECPPGSNNFVSPMSAILVDRHTLAIRMPECPVDIPQQVSFCLANKYSIDNPLAEGDDDDDDAGPDAVDGGTCVVFHDVYTYIPVPPIVEPFVTAIYPTVEGADSLPGCGQAHGLQRFLVVGDWFDFNTTLNGGFEFVFPTGEIVQTQRTILHNRNLLEIYTKRLPDSLYPLASDISATVRVRNVVGHADFEDAMLFKATPDAGAPPILTALCAEEGPHAGGNEVLIFGENFDTDTTVRFGGKDATDVQFIHSGLLIVTAPPSGTTPPPIETGDPGPEDTISVVVEDDGELSQPLPYVYTDSAGDCPALGYLDPDNGSSTGGYPVLAYGVGFSPTTQIEFGEGDGNFSHDIFFVTDNLLRVVAPEAFPSQIGATVEVGATDPLRGCDETLKTVEFTYTAAPQAAPEILFVDTTVEVPPTATPLPALHRTGGDRMLVIGRNFDQMTTFDITQDSETEPCTFVEILTPNIAVMTSPAAPADDVGEADLVAHNTFGDSPAFKVEYVETPPPVILDVRNLDDGTQTAPIDGMDRLIVFGDNFVLPLTVTLSGCDLSSPTETLVLELDPAAVTLVEDHLIGINVPADKFCEGTLGIKVETDFGTAEFNDGAGAPIFELIGPQPPIVTGVFESKFNSNGGQEAVLFGRYFTSTTRFEVRTDLMTPGTFSAVLDFRIVSDTVAIVIMPALPGGAPPRGTPGQVKATETDAFLASKIAPDDPFTISERTVKDDGSGDIVALFYVCDDESPVLFAVHEDHGSIDGGEQVILVGAGFLKATGETNIKEIRFEDPVDGDIGTYTQVTEASLPLDSLDPANKGKYFVLSDNEIVVITNVRDPISPETSHAPVDVHVESLKGDVTTLMGGYTYMNTPAVRTPHLLGITPNETRLNGGTSHLLSGQFMTEADEIVFTRTSPAATYAIPLDGGAFSEVNDHFLVFTMPDLSGTFAAGDELLVHATKTVGGVKLTSNTISPLKVTFAGPPTITPDLSPKEGTAFGGTEIEITGALFTTNTQVLFGTMPARHVIYVSPTMLKAIAPSLPPDLPNPGLDLQNVDSEDPTVDVAVFTQGGWAVLADAYTFTTAEPIVEGCDPEEVAAGETVRVTVWGHNFVPGATEADRKAGSIGTISDLVVHDFHRLSFDYEAGTFGPMEDGPFEEEITISTNHGIAAAKCGIDVHLPPYLSECETSYSLNSHASPTVGVDEDNSFVVVTLTGGNLVAGGTLHLRTRSTVDWIELTEMAGAFTSGGQFKVDGPDTISFSAPNIFNDNTPTLLDGNPNVGHADVRYESPAQQLADLEDCFRYLPSLIDFVEYDFSLPSDGEPVGTSVAAGDINADGVPDAAVLAHDGPVDVWIMIANTFGPVDINGDGVAPDFDGTFTPTALNHDLGFFPGQPRYRDVKTIHIAQLDDDPEAEILVPGSTGGGAGAKVLIVDMDDTGIAAEILYEPDLGPGLTYHDILTITVGDFDGDARDDFAYITHDDPADRRLCIVTSPTGAFTFSETSAALPAAMDDFTPGQLVAGNFDGVDHDDLMYPTAYRYAAAALGDTSDYKVYVVTVDTSGATPVISSQDPLTNFSGGRGYEISVFDIDDNGTDDAIVLVHETAHSDVFPETSKGPGFAVVLDPIASKEADAYIPIGFAARFCGIGDINADGRTDLVIARAAGQFTVYYGDPTAVDPNDHFIPSGRAWTQLSAEDRSGTDVLWGVALADINGDGLDEIWTSDTGVLPREMALWSNTSR